MKQSSPKQSSLSTLGLVFVSFLVGLIVSMSLNLCSMTNTTPIPNMEIVNTKNLPPPPASSEQSPEKTKSSQGVCDTKAKNTAEALDPLPTLRHRVDLGAVLELDKQFDYKIGAELGVQRGHFAKTTLSKWKKMSEYWLVDLWAQQENYVDVANVNNTVQDQIYNEALASTEEWKSKIKICRNYTTNCAPRFADGYFDYIYVDARHDFKGVLVDMDMWWPKLKTGGLFAGHDYIEQRDVGTTQDWTKNFDGTVDTTGTVVRGAVELFFTDSIWGVSEELLIELRKLMKTPKNERMRSIKVTGPEGWPSWYCRK